MASNKEGPVSKRVSLELTVRRAHVGGGLLEVGLIEFKGASALYQLGAKAMPQSPKVTSVYFFTDCLRGHRSTTQIAKCKKAFSSYCIFGM
jgi:hypothetical protein